MFVEFRHGGSLAGCGSLSLGRPVESGNGGWAGLVIVKHLVDLSLAL